MIFETGCLTIDKYSLFDQFIKMAMIAYIKKSFRLIAFLSIVSVVTGCYLPGSFDAEIELSRTGHYKMSFDGYIVEITLYDGSIVARRDGYVLLQSHYELQERLSWNPTWQLPERAEVDDNGRLRVWYLDGEIES